MEPSETGGKEAGCEAGKLRSQDAVLSHRGTPRLSWEHVAQVRRQPKRDPEAETQEQETD